MVITQQAAQSLAALNMPVAAGVYTPREQQHIVLPLVIPFGMEMFDIFAQRSPQRALAKEDHLAQALLLHRLDPVQRLRAMGIRDKPTAPRSPWQNPYVERLIGTIRRECLDHLIVFGQAHLRRILGKYAAYYNESRVHRSLDKDAPFHRTIERLGVITSRPVLGGLHHQYCRI